MTTPQQALSIAEKALEYCAESADRGRHDGLPEEGPVHDDIEMWARAREALAAIRAARDTPDDADVEYGLEWLMGVKESLQTEMDYERDHPRAGEMDHYRSLKQDFDCVDGIIRALQSKRDAQGGK